MFNEIIIWFSLVLGFFLMYFSFDIDSKIPVTCKSRSVRSANRGLLLLGMLFVAVSVGMITAPQLCDCSKLGVKEGPVEIYAGFMLILSIVLVVLSSIIKANTTKDKDCYIDSASPGIVLGIGITMMVLSLVVFGNSAYQIYGEKSKSSFPKSSYAWGAANLKTSAMWVSSLAGMNPEPMYI